ncbi:hypothetical protein CTAYLR_005716 [Chrysophaeum taylorii]|uniref:Phytanoyl-CoA dioxygenase n=1 Tax=Chrysophaeum taylorii TaxID=2483200 RepID=A0AAD7UKQ4_9STRA|nr:hypothetical protein CTAYLR_005716 [Chrysophaeum taylorii]
MVQGAFFFVATFIKLCDGVRGSNCAEPIPRVVASATRPELVASIVREFGAVVVEGAADEAAMDALSVDLRERNGTFFGAKGSFAGADTTRNAGKPLAESTVAQRLAVDELVVGTARDLLEPFCKRIILGTCSVISVHPPNGEPAPPQDLHRDDSMWAAKELAACDAHLSLSAMWAIKDFTAANGATRIALRSHLSCRAREPTDFSADELAVAEMRKGDVLLWAGGTIHGAGSHMPGDVDNTTREGCLFIYNLGFLRSEHNFHNAMPPDVIGALPEDLKHLMGYYGKNAIEHPWYTGPVYAQPFLGAKGGSAAGDGVQFNT